MKIIKVQKITNEAIIPSKSYAGDAGFDLYSAEEIIIKPGEIKGVKTGVKMEIPKGYVGLIWDKSGLAIKYGVKTMAGVIDSGYRGEIVVILTNLSRNNFKVEKKSKIAQILIQKFENAKIEIRRNLSKTKRGKNGFGSTGIF